MTERVAFLKGGCLKSQTSRLHSFSVWYNKLETIFISAILQDTDCVFNAVKLLLLYISGNETKEFS